MEKFLDFWSHYNATIIEGLVALILISVIYLSYRMFFGAKGSDALDTVGAGGAGIDTSHIEKTLQKILEQQASSKASPPADDSKNRGGATASAEMIQEVTSLKKSVEEKDRYIGQLKSQVEVAEKLAAASAAAAAGGAPVAPVAAAPAAGLGEKERQDYEAKIKDLEAKLAEYEIISEDIADVSFFKEENARLNSELEALKASGAGAPAAPPAAAVSPAPAPEESATAMSQEAIDAALLKELSSQSASEAPAAAAAAPEASAEAMNAIDDSLMAEFARAVEGQKEGTLEEPGKSEEEAKLLEEFENFSKKG